MKTHKSVVSQTLHYMSRPHSQIPEGALECKAAWRGADLKDTKEWIYFLTSEQITDFSKMLAAVKNTRKPLGEISVADCPLPTLASQFQVWQKEVLENRGFILIRGLPVEKYSKADCEIIFWCFGLHMGVPGAQNSSGDLLTHVLDEGKGNSDFSRLYKTSASIAYHCDAADMVGLMCIQNSKSGGRSRIASSVTVFNELFKRSPKDAAVLFSPFYLDARGENGMDYFSIPPLRYDGENLRTFYHSDYFRSAKRYSKIKSDIERYESVLDTYEKIASDSAIYLEMDLTPGDIQLLSNHTVIHARTEYQDRDGSENRRHLLRLWISGPEHSGMRARFLKGVSKLSLLRSLLSAKLRSRRSSPS